jgi:hypothetical protein
VITVLAGSMQSDVGRERRFPPFLPGATRFGDPAPQREIGPPTELQIRIVPTAWFHRGYLCGQLLMIPTDQPGKQAPEEPDRPHFLTQSSATSADSVLKTRSAAFLNTEVTEPTENSALKT